MTYTSVFAALFVATTFIAPVTMRADEHERRYYDKEHRDYHTWDDHEDRAYRVYLGEQHREYREFRVVRPVHQREYYRWRHEHPDHVLFKVEVK
jgi:hypothetical protein